jgi:hypothetical protein
MRKFTLLASTLLVAGLAFWVTIVTGPPQSSASVRNDAPAFNPYDLPIQPGLPIAESGNAH